MNNKYSLPKDGGLIAESAPRDIIHRYEKIHTKVYENEYKGVQYVADAIVKAIRTYNEIHSSNEVYEEPQPFVLGLTTGRTPLGLYRELVKRHQEGSISFRNVAVYSLDEFYPIKSTEQQSRNYRIHEEFLNHIDILPENVHIPNGTIAEDRVSEYCASYDHAVRHIDLMIIGVGEDGQIGFNEPGSYVRSRTRLVQLTYNTRKIQSGAFYGLENTPKMAITMGIDTIMRADRIILMAWGENKAQIIQKVVEGEITNQVPASYLQGHSSDRRKRRTTAHPRADAVDGRSLRMDPEIRPQGRRMALRRGEEADPETHLQGLHREFAGRTARTGPDLRPDQHRRLQRPATHHLGVAGRQTQRRRFDAPRSVDAVPEARGDLLAAPR